MSEKTLALWSLRWTVAWGWKWIRERGLTEETRDAWLALWRKDEPQVLFVASRGKPRRNAAKLAAWLALPRDPAATEGRP